MRRVVCEAIGDFDQLKVVDEESPAPGPGQVLVDVEAAGVNFGDGLFVQGKYQIKPPTLVEPVASPARRNPKAISTVEVVHCLQSS